MGVEESLDSPIAASFSCPTGDTQHGDPSTHGQQSANDDAQLAQGCLADVRKQAVQQW